MRRKPLSFTRKPGVPYDGFSIVSGSESAILRTSVSVAIPGQRTSRARRRKATVRRMATRAEPLDVRGILRTERRLFVDLLRTLDDTDWHQPTECPAYNVQGVATHVLGDDFSLLSRQRDAAPSGLISM